MNTKPEAYTYGEISYLLPVKIISLTGLKIVQSINEHVRIYLKGIAPNTLALQDIEQIGDRARIEIKLPDRRVPYFAGVCTDI